MLAKVSTIAVAVSVLSGSVSAHGYLRFLDYKGVSYNMWEPFSDPYMTPLPLRYDRTIADNGPVVGMTTSNITCNNGGNNPANVGMIEVAAGDTVKLVWDQWGSSHSGPVMTYMAKCTPNCASFKGDTGSPWFKIEQMGYDASKSPPWGSDYLAKLGAWWDVTIPPTIAAGEYLLRHEILGLHVAGTANGAQFYPSCVHLKVTGGGSDNPSGVALPGAYQPNDSDGILIQLYQINQGQKIYTAPGGPVWSKAAPNPQSAATAVMKAYTPTKYAPSVRGGATTTAAGTSRTTTLATSTTTSRVVTTTTPATRTTTTTSRTTTTPTTTSRTTTTGGSSGGSPLYGQCGGIGWTGPTTCASGRCVSNGAYYSQCVP